MSVRQSVKEVTLTGSNAKLLATQTAGTVTAGATVNLPNLDVSKYARISVVRISGLGGGASLVVKANWKSGTIFNDTLFTNSSYIGGTTSVKTTSMFVSVNNPGAADQNCGDFETYGMVL